MKVDKISIGKIKSNPDNPRKISIKQLEKLKKSISEFPQMLELRPIVVDSSNMILGGNMRLRALKELGYDEVPYIKVDDLTPEQKNQFIIKDNLNYGDWDWEILNTTFDFDEVEDWGLEVPLFDFPLLQKQELLPIDELKYYPQNYKKHPQDQIDHLVTSIQEHGLYRNIIISKDGYIVVGNGLVQALKYMGIKKIPVIRMEFNHDESQAQKLLIADNEISHLSVLDDRMLSDVLKEIKDEGGLEGTGFDEMMLANLLFVTRPSSEIQNLNKALEWVGMPDHLPEDGNVKIIFNFRTPEDRESFMEIYEFDMLKAKGNAWVTWYPFTGKDDVQNLKFE